jgi:hypothetical protein
VLKTFEYRLLCGLGAFAVFLVCLNVALYYSNHSIQASVNARAQYIQQTTPIGELYQSIAKALAELAVKNKDEQVRGMLSQEGFTINQAPVNSAPATPTRGK